MANIHLPEDWELPESAVTEASAYWNRRRFLKALGLGGLAATGLAVGGRSLLETALAEDQDLPTLEKLTAKLNPDYKDAGRKLTQEQLATRYNNFYEFTTTKDAVWKVAKSFKLDPYTLEVGGLVDKPGKLGLEDIEKLGLEERIYRFRCVEAWSMTVPWIGVPLHKVLERFGVKKEAKYVAFTSFLDPEQAPGQRKQKWYKWPYYEALRVDEAMNELVLVVTGVYGKRLPPQSGAPLRVIVPWKYGFKGPKSVVELTLTNERPQTFWNDAQPKEYSWVSNVEPNVPHPRWSQAYEKHLQSAGALGLKYERVKTLLHNGYGKQVAHLYRS